MALLLKFLPNFRTLLIWMYVGAFNLIIEHMSDFSLFGVYFVLMFISCLEQIINYTFGYQYFLVGVHEPCLMSLRFNLVV
jgi:hypothetical protein